MALPNGVTTATLTLGPYLDAEGDVQYEGLTGFITPSSPVRHIATGAVIVKQPIKVVIGQGGIGSVVLPQTDQAGIAPSPFTYTLTWQVGRFDGSPGDLTFALPVSAGSTVDFDTLAPTPAGISVPTGVVSVNGKGGTVSLTASDVGADAAGAASAAQAASLQKTANLSDLGSAASARTNLGLGSAATQPASAFDAAGAASTAAAAEVTRADGKYVALPSGGTDGQVLGKSGTAVVWLTQTSGGGGGTAVTDNGDGTAVTTSISVVDHGDGTAAA